MQRYHASGCTSAVNHNAIGGASARETARADSSSVPSNLSLSSRRPSPLKPYKLRCDKEPLNSRLGPPDFLPQTPNCPEESLTREYVQSGYRETVDGLEEAREVSLTQVQTFTKPLVVNCKDAIRKRLRAINESRAQKRKAGQVYGVPLSGSQLTKPGVFPELRPCGEDFRKKWIEGLSQQHKRLRSLADNVPQGYKRGNLFEVLIRNNVPLLRATWFIKITYLNQVRPGSGSSDRTQLARTELWTKDVVEYLQSLLDDFFSKNSSHPTSHSRDLSTKMSYSGLSQHKGDPASAVVDSQGPTLHFKWWYMVRLLQWHQEEGLLLPSLIIDWVLSQLQEKEVLEALQLVLPIIYGVLETIIQSQTYVRILVRIAVRFISESSPGGSDLVENSRRTYTISSLVEMLRYLILAVPDTFVALDCFPLPSCVTHPVTDGNFASKASDDGGKRRYRMTEVSALFTSKDLDSRYQSISFGRVVSSIQKRADNLAKAAKPGYIGNSVAKVVETLDKSLVQGEISGVYKYLFEDFCDGAVNESWIKEVSLSLRSTMKWLRTVSLSFVSSVFFLCEWATCDFRDIRTAPSREMKFTGGEDFSHVYIAIRILKMKIMDLQSSYRHKNDNSVKANTSLKPSTQQNNQSGMTSVGSLFEPKSHSKNMEGRSKNPSDMFKSPGPLHDIIVCWIDQHDVQKGKGFRHLQLLIFELIRAGIFYPHSYVRQLIVSGIMDTNGPAVDSDRRRRHHQILKQFPGNFLHDSLEEAKIAQGPQLLEIMHAYSSERRLVLRGLVYDQDNDFSSYASTSSVHKQRKQHSTTEDGVYRASVNHLKAVHSSPNMLPSKKSKSHADIEELKVAISVLLRFPNGLSTSPDTVSDESQGINAKRSFASIYSKLDGTVGTPGCEECIRAKKQKLSEERSSYLQAPSPLPSDEEDTWWVRKGSKSSESLKVEPQVKSTKIIPKSRQKGVLKTLSLAQLAAARIEGSQGASTSHVCDNRVNCPHHRTGAEGETLKPVDWIRTSGDIVLVGKALKGLRLVEKSAIASWLIAFIRQLIEETEKSTAKAGQFGRTVTPVDERSLGWKLGEDELSAILYFMDCCNDLLSAVKFLLWLLPRVLIPANSTINSRRGSLILPKNSENQVCEVGEAHLISSLRRYENILIATDLIPEALSSTISRATSILVSNGRVSSSAAMAYARYLLKKYNNVSRVIEWEKNFKATCDKRLLSELESGWSIDGELGFPLGVPSGVEDPDDFFRQKISGGRLSRVGMGMRDLVQRHVEDAFNNYFGKERKLFAGGPPKSSSLEKLDDGYQIAQQISTGMIDCMRQTGGAAQEGDPSLVSSAVSAIVNSVGLTLSKIPDFLSGTGSGSSSTGLLNFARRILHIHISCLCLLKEALGERQNRVFDIALAIEASSALSGFFPPGRSSSLAHDSNTNISSENMKMVVGRAAKIAAAVSALVIGAVVQGVTSLERLVSLFKLKEGLDFIQFIRNTRSNSNGNSRSGGAFKMDNGIEVYVHWFRVLVGNCRTVFDGSIVELLGEPSIVALSRMQRMLPLTLVLPPAYSIFAFLIWRPFIPTSSLVSREDPNQFYQSLTMAMSDAIRHLPFRDVCLRDSLGFYDLVSADSSDVEFAAILDLNGLDLHTKSMAFVPLRARLFLNGLIDCKIPDSIDDWSNRVSGFGDFKISYPDSKTKLLARLVHVLDTLQPAKFHWQWVELRLLLNEQGLIDKLETQDISLANAIRSSSPSPEKNTVSENEKNFIEIILTRLLVRPDAAPLFSDVIHLFGRLLENSMLLQAKWFLGGPDVLLGRKSIRKKLINIAEGKGLSTKSQFWKPWGWYNTDSHDTPSGDKKKLEASHLEEGEVVEEGMGDSGKSGRVGPTQTMESEGFNVSQQYVTEKALIDLVLPCIDQSSEDSRNTFANDLIKQLSNIEQQISAITRGSSKLVGPTPSGIEGPISKSSSRKGMKGGSPGLARRSAVGPVDSAPPTPAALKASLSLRLRLLLRLLPVIRADGEPSGRNMRHMLASVILRLLGSRAVHEDADVTLYPGNSAIFEEVESPSEASSTVYSDLAGESLFDRLLLVLHGLLSTSQPSWLRSKPASKSTYDSNKDSNGLDHELAESLQNDLERIEMPETVRSRIQAAMPILHPSVWCPVSCPPPTVPISALASLHPSSLIPGISPGNPSGPHGTKAPSSRAAANKNVKSKNILVQPDYDMEIDPWILLEEGAGSGQSSSNSASIGGSDHANLKASSFLKGAVRVRRTDLMYIGVVDDES